MFLFSIASYKRGLHKVPCDTFTFLKMLATLGWYEIGIAEIADVRVKGGTKEVFLGYCLVVRLEGMR